MKYIVRIFGAFLFLLSITSAIQASPKPIVQIETNMGTIIVELNHQRAPTTVANFLYYVKKDFYNGTIFHRVIKDFMIQGGGFDLESKQKPTRDPIRNESTNGLFNSMGTIAMARTSDVDSATSQFYINVNENRALDATFDKPGYAVFGSVIEGLDVVLKIADVAVEPMMGLGDTVPSKPVIIQSITLLNSKKPNTNTIKEEK